jgi:hypothetical protein
MRKEKLNCAANFGAKRAFLCLDANDLPRQQRFLLEAICIWAGREKMMSDTGYYIWYHAHRHLVGTKIRSNWPIHQCEI